MITDTGWRAGLPARLGAAVVVGVLTGAAVLLTGHLMPLTPVGVDCRPAGSIGCAVGGTLGGLLLGALRWLFVVVLAGLVVGALLGVLSDRLAGVRLGVGTVAGWPVALWVLATLLRPTGVRVNLTDAALLGYVAAAFVLAAGLTAPQVRPAARLITAVVLGIGVVVVLEVS